MRQCFAPKRLNLNIVGAMGTGRNLLVLNLYSPWLTCETYTYLKVTCITYNVLGVCHVLKLLTDVAKIKLLLDSHQMSAWIITETLGIYEIDCASKYHRRISNAENSYQVGSSTSFKPTQFQVEHSVTMLS